MAKKIAPRTLTIDEVSDLTDAAIALLQHNFDTRVGTLAYKDMILIEDTIASMRFLRMKILRQEKIILTKQFMTFFDKLAAQYEKWTNVPQDETFPVREKILAIIEIEYIFLELQDIIFFTVAVFNEEMFDKPKGLMSAIFSSNGD